VAPQILNKVGFLVLGGKENMGSNGEPITICFDMKNDLFDIHKSIF